MAKKSATKKAAKKSAKKSAPKSTGGKRADGTKNSLVANINRKKKAGTSRSKKDSTISAESYQNMKAGWPNSKKKKAAKKTAKKKTSQK